MKTYGKVGSVFSLNLSGLARLRKSTMYNLKVQNELDAITM